jgi:hypothetical protein
VPSSPQNAPARRTIVAAATTISGQPPSPGRTGMCISVLRDPFREGLTGPYARGQIGRNSRRKGHPGTS